MSAEMVRVRFGGPNGPEYREMPRSEVPAGYTPVRMVGIGECYVDMSTYRASPGFRHPPFPDAAKERIVRIHQVVEQYSSHTFEQFEEGFRKDMHPWREIALWELIVDAHQRFTSHLTGEDQLTSQKKEDIFKAIMWMSNHFPDHGRVRLGATASLTAKRANEIFDWMCSNERASLLKERRQTLRELLCNSLPGPETVSIHALFGEECKPNEAASFIPEELIAAAEVILGVDVNTGKIAIFSGRKLLESCEASGQGIEARVLHVEMDFDTTEPEKLAALVKVVKGEHD